MFLYLRNQLIHRPFWHKIALSFMMGLVCVLALPPFQIWPMAFLSLSLFFLILDHIGTKKGAFLIGWAYGVGFFGAGLYWLTHAFLVNSDQHAWMIPIALPLLALFVGLFIAFGALIAHLLCHKIPNPSQILARLLVFACIWMGLEWVRSWIFTGFPWNLIATIWGASDVMLQNAALFGAFGFSFVTVLIATLPAALFYFTGPKRVVIAGACCVLILSLYEYGAWRLSGAELKTHEGVLLRLVQPNIAQNEKWKSDKTVENFNRLFDLSITRNLPPDQRPTHILWPETAVTFPVNRDPNVKRALAQLAPDNGSIIVGSPLLSAPGVQPFEVWNSLIAIDARGQTVGRYDKSHLVPFGEYIPFRNILPIGKITAGKTDFSAGGGLTTLTLPGLPPFSPLICYEVIFPHQVIDLENRPDWLLNLTNDGWYGDTPGPYQHAMSARMRSIEEGLPLVRVANTGISFVTDSYGRLQGDLSYGMRDFLDFQLPKPLAQRPLGARYSSGVMVFFIIITLSAYGWVRFRNPKN